MPAQKGSICSNLVGLDVGASRFAVTDNPDKFMRKALATTRYPEEIKGMTFSCATYLAVPSRNMTNVEQLVKVTRLT